MRKRKRKLAGQWRAIRRRWRRKIWSREQRRIERGGKPKPHLGRPGSLYWVIVKAPAVLDAFKPASRHATIEFLTDLRSQTRREGVGVTIDLSEVVEIRPTGALLVLAEMDRASAGQPANSIRIIRCRNRIVDAVMCHIGIYSTFENPSPEADRDDVKHWRMASGVASEGAKGGAMLEGYEGRLADGLTGDLYAGITEAMTNTVHHAYESNTGQGLRRFIGKRWWALSQEFGGRLTVAVCDLGIGIPRSLPRSSTFSQPLVRSVWRGLGLDNSDASAIKVALELGRTSTGREGRGRGLSEIVEAANLSAEGGVIILSNRGVFVDGFGKSYATDDTHSIRGTLVVWSVRIANDDQ